MRWYYSVQLCHINALFFLPRWYVYLLPNAKTSTRLHFALFNEKVLRPEQGWRDSTDRVTASCKYSTKSALLFPLTPTHTARTDFKLQLVSRPSERRQPPSALNCLNCRIAALRTATHPSLFGLHAVQSHFSAVPLNHSPAVLTVVVKWQWR